jgi:hypothetical protein
VAAQIRTKGVLVNTTATRSGVSWRHCNLPQPPPYTLRNVIRVIGPGAILLGLSLGSGDWVLGPVVTARWGTRFLWICTVSVLLQALLNTEMARYTLATGESIFAGFMRGAPGPRFWGSAYALLHSAQVGWPGWALAAAAALVAAFLGRPLRAEDGAIIVALGYLIFLGAVFVTFLGPRVRRTVELCEWLVMGLALLFLTALALSIVRWTTWLSVLVGFLPPVLGEPALPSDMDWWLLVAFAAYSGGGGTINASLTHWLRDKGFGMAGTVEGRAVVVGGEIVRFARDGMTFAPTEMNLAKWHQWWRYLRTDFWFLWAAGCIAGMTLPVLVTAQLVGPGETWTGFTAAIGLAQGLGRAHGLVLWTGALLTGFGILAATQVGIVAGYARSVTDILWTARARSRPAGAAGEAGRVYWLSLAGFTLAGCLAMTLADPLTLIVISANVAAFNFVVLSLHTLWVNRTLLPRALRPALWRELAALACAIFFAALLGRAALSSSILAGLLG